MTTTQVRGGEVSFLTKSCSTDPGFEPAIARLDGGRPSERLEPEVAAHWPEPQPPDGGQCYKFKESTQCLRN
jgi:hypothetical protein